MKMSERLRWWLAFAGIALWLTLPIIIALGGAAKHRYRCRDRVFTGQVDDCFNDYLPIAEFIFPFLVLAFAYPFARFAYSLFAPAIVYRSRWWRLASREAGSDNWPVIQSFAGTGLVVAVWNLATWHLAWDAWPYVAYWIAVSGWLLIGILSGKPEKSN